MESGDSKDFHSRPCCNFPKRQESHLKIKCIIIYIRRGFVHRALALPEVQNYLLKSSSDVLVLLLGTIYSFSTPPVAVQNHYVAKKSLRC